MSKNKHIIIGTLLVAGAFVVAAWWVSRPDPSRVILEAQRNLAAERFFRAETTFTVDGVFDRPELSFGTAAVTLTGTVRTDADRTDPTSTTTSSAFDFSLASGEDTLIMKGEARRKDHTHYLRLDDVSDALFPGIADAKGQWMRSIDPFIDLLIRPTDDDVPQGDIDAAGYAELQRAAGQVPLFLHEDTLPSETIDGMKTLHYAVSFRPDAAAAFLTRIRQLRSGEASQPEDYAMELAKVMSWGEPTGEVWIGKKDHRFRKIVFSTKLSDATGGAHLQAEILFSRFGTAFDVETPVAQDVEDVLGRVISGRLRLSGDRAIEIRMPEAAPEEDTAPESSADTEEEPLSGAPKDSDGDGLSDTEEFIYGCDPWNPDTDGDGWSDGTEIANGKNPVGPGVLFGFGL